MLMAVAAADAIVAAGTTVAATAGVPFTATLTRFTATPAGSASDFVATIDWGDQMTTPGTVAPVAGGGYGVVGTHTYAAVGSRPVSVTIRRAFGTDTATANSTAVVTPLPFTGGLDPASDTGASNSDGITRLNQPTLSGTAAPFSLIQVSAQRGDQLGSFPLGATIADGTGAWRLQLDPLADGSYALSANVSQGAGGAVQTVALPTMTIDTVAPRVVGFRFDRRAARILATFRDDRTGMDLGTLRTPRNFNLIGRVYRKLASATAPTVVTTAIVPSDPQAAEVVLGAPGTRPAPSTLRILSGGVADVAGNALDGENRGRLPSGNGRPGGEFVVSLASGKAR